jgi:hypothetical protein
MRKNIFGAFLFWLLTQLSPFGTHAQFSLDVNDGKWRGKFNMVMGTNTFRGYTVGFMYGACKKNNNYSAFIQLNSEVGQNTAGFIAPVYYNDKLYEFGLLYGRSYQHQRLLLEVDLGPAFTIYKDKEVGYSSGYLSTAFSESRTVNSLGLHIKARMELFVSKGFALGLQGGTNLNNAFINSFGGLQFSAYF